MKKLALFLVICIAVSVFVSCAKTDTGETEPAVTEGSVNIANSASSSPKITRDDISSVIDGMVRKVSTKDRSTDSLVLPSYLSYDFVKELSIDNYREYVISHNNFKDAVIDELDELVRDLPENCILSHRPTWIINMMHEVERYIVPSPEFLPDDTEDDLVLYLEYMYYEARYDYEYAHYYDEDMTALHEKYSDIGTVIIDRGRSWFYLDLKCGTLELIEFFPDSEKVQIAYYDIIDNKMRVDHGEKLTQSN